MDPILKLKTPEFYAGKGASQRESWQLMESAKYCSLSASPRQERKRREECAGINPNQSRFESTALKSLIHPSNAFIVAARWEI